jgi:NifU-like protein involved in Fe-S cluster formation
MRPDFDVVVEELQEKIFDEAKKALGEEGFQRWRNPLYNGKLEDADSHGRITGKCGDTMEVFLIFEGDRVKRASFITDGCGSSTVCGSFAVEMAIGKSTDQLCEITGEKILERLGRFPKEDEHCAFLAAEALQEALNNYMTSQRDENDQKMK